MIIKVLERQNDLNETINHLVNVFNNSNNNDSDLAGRFAVNACAMIETTIRQSFRAVEEKACALEGLLRDMHDVQIEVLDDVVNTFCGSYCLQNCRR